MQSQREALCVCKCGCAFVHSGQGVQEAQSGRNWGTCERELQEVNQGDTEISSISHGCTQIHSRQLRYTGAALEQHSEQDQRDCPQDTSPVKISRHMCVLTVHSWHRTGTCV